MRRSTCAVVCGPSIADVDTYEKIEEIRVAKRAAKEAAKEKG